MSQHETIADERSGYRRLNPLPKSEDLQEFYESAYYDLIRKGGRAPELRRLQSVGEERSRELDWLERTLYADVKTVLDRVAPGRRLLDVGCGTGDFVRYMSTGGFDVQGIEPSEEAAQAAREKGQQVEQTTLRDYVASSKGETQFDAVILLNVLEHVPDPEAYLEDCAELLRKGGVICIRVPNDFTPLQEAARAKLGGREWWVAAPDHINYFSFESLRSVLDHHGFDVVFEQGDFPMELFLLFGEDYTSDPGVGAACHARRVSFELSVGDDLRRKMYETWAKVGMGRNCLVFAERR